MCCYYLVKTWHEKLSTIVFYNHKMKQHILSFIEKNAINKALLTFSNYFCLSQ